MKQKKATGLLLVGLLVVAGILAAAVSGTLTAGSSEDPLISLDWITKNLIPQTAAQAESSIDRLEELAGDLSDLPTTGAELRVKRGDVLTLESGSGLTCLAGEMEVNPVSGAVVDLTVGTELGKGISSVQPDHRYLSAENTRARYTVASDTAVVRLTGGYGLEPSDQTDYNALADALKAMGLFRGSDTPYGSGYDLEMEPTRIQGLIMFLRLIGEEKAALAYTGSEFTFPDVPEWALPYVAYAYDKGYTKGYEVNEQKQVIFGTQDILTGRHYLTFLLRALDFKEETDFTWERSVTDARSLGLLTQGEVNLLSREQFLRSQVVYLSYFALSAKTADGRTTMLDRLTAGGAVSAEAARTTMSNVTVNRL